MMESQWRRTEFCEFESQIDSIDSSEQNIIVSLSNLEGNIWDGSIVMINAKGEKLFTKTNKVGASTVRFMNSGMQVLAGMDDGSLVMYSNYLEEIRRFVAHDDIISNVATSPSSYSHFASVSYDGCLCVWDWRSANPNSPIYSVEAHTGIVSDVSYNSINPNILATVGKDGLSRIWDIRNNSMECSQLFDLSQIGSSISFVPENEFLLLVGMEEGSVQLIDQRHNSILTSVMMHKGRIRRLKSNATATATTTTPMSSEPSPTTNTNTNRFVCVSEDMTASMICINDDQTINESMSSSSSSLPSNESHSHSHSIHRDGQRKEKVFLNNRTILLEVGAKLNYIRKTFMGQKKYDKGLKNVMAQFFSRDPSSSLCVNPKSLVSPRQRRTKLRLSARTSTFKTA
eukprot:gene2548-4977_t